MDTSDGVDGGVAGLMSTQLLIFGVDFDRITIWVDALGGRRIVSGAGSVDDDGPGTGIGAGGDETVRTNGAGTTKRVEGVGVRSAEKSAPVWAGPS